MKRSRGLVLQTREAIPLLLAILALASGATGSAGPPSGDHPRGGPPGQSRGGSEGCAPLRFSPALASPAAGDIYLRSESSTCTTLDVDLLVKDLSDIFTIGFQLDYPAAQLRYEGYSAGRLLKKGPLSIPPLFLVGSPFPGALHISMTRFAPDRSVTVKGSEVLITLHFSRVAAGVGALDFSQEPGGPVAARVVGAGGDPRNASFGPNHGGTVTVP